MRRDGRFSNTRNASLTCSLPASAAAREWNWDDASRLTSGREEVRKRLDELKEMNDTCERLAALLNELKGLLGKPDAFNRRLAEVDALRMKVNSMERSYRIISSLSQHAELQRFSADRRIGLAELKSTDLAKRQLERDVKFITAVIEGAAAAREVLEGSLKRFDQTAVELHRARPERKGFTR
jgi:hypothetical protein